MVIMFLLELNRLMFEGSFWFRNSNCRHKVHFPPDLWEFPCKFVLCRACSFEIQRLWIEMNSTTLRTKLLNDKSSNIYKITKCFHPGSACVPRGKPVWRWSTGLGQGLQCTGTSPCSLSPPRGWGAIPARVTGQDERAHRASHQPSWECCSSCPIPTWPCMLPWDSPCCTNNLHLFPSEPLSDCVPPCWTLLVLFRMLPSRFGSAQAVPEGPWAVPICFAPPHLSLHPCKPAAAPSPQIPGISGLPGNSSLPRNLRSPRISLCT